MALCTQRTHNAHKIVQRKKHFLPSSKSIVVKIFKNKILEEARILFKDTVFQNDSKTGINSFHSIAIIQIEQPKPSQWPRLGLEVIL